MQPILIAPAGIVKRAQAHQLTAARWHGTLAAEVDCQKHRSSEISATLVEAMEAVSTGFAILFAVEVVARWALEVQSGLIRLPREYP